MFKGVIEPMALHQRKFRAFPGLFTISNQFWARAGFEPDLVGPFTAWI